ncbi:reverse transcriptase domain-containing protein [Tanacetum coccineum]
MQWLSGKLSALNRFISKAAEKALPCLDTLKKCTNKKDFHWTTEAEEAFQEMKKLIAELPTLTAPKKEEELMVYLSAANEAGAKINYPPMEKLVLALVHAARRLRRHNGRGQLRTNKSKWTERCFGRRKSREEQEAPKAKTYENFRTEADIWKVYTDGASNKHECGAGLILIDPERVEYSYALRLNIANSNNDAEYEALLAASKVEGSYEEKGEKTKKYKEKALEMIHTFNDFQISHIPREDNKKADALSKLTAIQCEGLTKGVLIEELNERSMDIAEVNAVFEETTRTWMTPIQEYIKHGILPEDVAEA